MNISSNIRIYSKLTRHQKIKNLFPVKDDLLVNNPESRLVQPLQ